MSRFCDQCGEQVPDDAKFCPNCSHKLDDAGARDDAQNGNSSSYSSSTGDSDIFGILGLVFSILGGLLGLIFDIVALASSGSSEKGKKYAKIGLGIFGIWVVIGIILIIVAVSNYAAAAMR